MQYLFVDLYLFFAFERSRCRKKLDDGRSEGGAGVEVVFPPDPGFFTGLEGPSKNRCIKIPLKYLLINVYYYKVTPPPCVNCGPVTSRELMSEDARSSRGKATTRKKVGSLKCFEFII